MHSPSGTKDSRLPQQVLTTIKAHLTNLSTFPRLNQSQLSEN